MDEDTTGRRDAEEQPTTKRKRVRSGDSESDVSQDLSDAVPVTKKVSVSDMDLSSLKPDRVALLDAGAQYGKVIMEGGTALASAYCVSPLQVIDRRVRDLSVECLLFPLNVSASVLKEKGVR